MNHIKATCGHCGEEISLPVEVRVVKQDFYLYVGEAERTAHICHRLWVPIGVDDDTEPYVDPEWIKYEGDVE